MDKWSEGKIPGWSHYSSTVCQVKAWAATDAWEVFKRNKCNWRNTFLLVPTQAKLFYILSLSRSLMGQMLISANPFKQDENTRGTFNRGTLSLFKCVSSRNLRSRVWRKTGCTDPACGAMCVLWSRAAWDRARCCSFPHACIAEQTNSRALPFLILLLSLQSAYNPSMSPKLHQTPLLK